MVSLLFGRKEKVVEELPALSSLPINVLQGSVRSIPSELSRKNRGWVFIVSNRYRVVVDSSRDDAAAFAGEN